MEPWLISLSTDIKTPLQTEVEITLIKLYALIKVVSFHRWKVSSIYANQSTYYNIINRLKDRNYIVISINTEKALYRVEVKIKVPEEIRNKWNRPQYWLLDTANLRVSTVLNGENCYLLYNWNKTWEPASSILIKYAVHHLSYSNERKK